jgi:hypothetical protein
LHCLQHDDGRGKKRYDGGMRTQGLKIGVLAASCLAVLATPSISGAQTRSARDTATAYGARLNAKGQPANLNPARINNRIVSRIENRLDLRIERYRPDATNDPGAAFKATTDDKSHLTPVISQPQQQSIDEDGK